VIPLRAGDVLLAAGVSAITTLVLVKCATRLGLVDDARDAPDRKRHARPVPLVGGLSIAAAIAVLIAVRGAAVVGGEVVPGIAFDALHVIGALAIALVVGMIDDVAPRGLAVVPKLVGQALAAAVLALGLHVHGSPPEWWGTLLCLVAGVAAQNAANTFDNADGALCAVGAAGLTCASPLCGATLAFLPFNLSRGAASESSSTRARTIGIPRAWLGDGGSHLLGILLLSTPVAWAALVLPLLDLVRVACVRARHGDPIWRGDRRHLAHRLEARGWPAWVVALTLTVLATPPIAAAYIFFWP
jgi:UDP-GlcNAc:undecaprenyl-phosphate GlcNAc-1-phosphate transferase